MKITYVLPIFAIQGFLIRTTSHEKLCGQVTKPLDSEDDVPPSLVTVHDKKLCGYETIEIFYVQKIVTYRNILCINIFYHISSSLLRYFVFGTYINIISIPFVTKPYISIISTRKNSFQIPQYNENKLPINEIHKKLIYSIHNIFINIINTYSVTLLYNQQKTLFSKRKPKPNHPW